MNCTAIDCNNMVIAKGYCSKHYNRFHYYGSPYITKQRPKGQGQIFHGYKLVTVDGKQVREHRVIMEQFLGRKLKPFPIEIVHHINGNTLDNRIENLKIITQAEHIRSHVTKSIIVDGKKLCTTCHNFLPITNFYRYKTGHKSSCITCSKRQRRELGPKFPPA